MTVKSHKICKNVAKVKKIDVFVLKTRYLVAD